MTTFDTETVPPPGVDESVTALSFDRTIDRRLVHRTALEEVFLTDFRSHADGTFTATARLPRAHAYYNDQTNHPAVHDPIAIFECARQMLLCALHLHHDAPAAMKSITATCGIEITDPLALLSRDYDLELHGSVREHRERDGVTTRVVHAVEVRQGGLVIGTVVVDTAQKEPARYELLRMALRTTPPPMSSELVAAEPVSRVAPYLVGRENGANVVLLAPVVIETRLLADLRIPVSHSGMFDHAQDHVPGPVMMEAARQAATLLLGELFGLASSKTVVASIEAEYTRFAELDSVITIDATAGARPTDPITVTFTQQGEPVARLVVGMSTTMPAAPDLPSLVAAPLPQ